VIVAFAWIGYMVLLLQAGAGALAGSCAAPGGRRMAGADRLGGRIGDSWRRGAAISAC